MNKNNIALENLLLLLKRLNFGYELKDIVTSIDNTIARIEYDSYTKDVNAMVKFILIIETDNKLDANIYIVDNRNYILLHKIIDMSKKIWNQAVDINSVGKEYYNRKEKDAEIIKERYTLPFEYINKIFANVDKFLEFNAR